MVHVIVNRFFPSNTYLLVDENTNECVVVDPGLDGEAILNAIDAHGIKPIGILCTHGHFDHIGSVSLIKSKFPEAVYYLHREDLKISQSVNFYIKLAKIDKWVNTITPDVLLTEKSETIEIGNFKFTSFNFPGHTRGSCVFQIHEQLFTGDIIYPNGLGLNSFPGQEIPVLKTTLQELVGFFSGDSMIYPGHGPAAKLLDITLKNQELKNFIA